MRTVTVAWEPGADRFVAAGTSPGHLVVVGAPRSEETRRAAPEATGFSATELLLAGAGACAAWDVVEILRKGRAALTGLEVRVEGQQGPEPPWEYRRVTLHVRVTGKGIELKAAERAASLAIERYCSVLATMRGICSIDWRVSVEEESAEPAA